MNEDDAMRPFLDALLCFICVLTAIVALLHVTTEETDPSVQTSVVYKVIIAWDVRGGTQDPSYENGGSSSLEDDVDLWVRDPDSHLCGYKRREGGEGSLMSLTHDDVGTNAAKQIKEHVEVINLRGTVVGEYVVNCHMYSKRNSEPTKVRVKLVKMKPLKDIIEREVTLRNSGDEAHAFRFYLNKDGQVIHTVDNLPTNLVTK